MALTGTCRFHHKIPLRKSPQRAPCNLGPFGDTPDFLGRCHLWYMAGNPRNLAARYTQPDKGLSGQRFRIRDVRPRTRTVFGCQEFCAFKLTFQRNEMCRFFSKKIAHIGLAQMRRNAEISMAAESSRRKRSYLVKKLRIV